MTRRVIQNRAIQIAPFTIIVDVDTDNIVDLPSCHYQSR